MVSPPVAWPESYQPLQAGYDDERPQTVKQQLEEIARRDRAERAARRVARTVKESKR